MLPLMTTVLALQWATALGFGALVGKLFDIAWAGIKEARAARRAPLTDLEVARRSRLVWMDYATMCKSIAVSNGLDPHLLPPLPVDPMLQLPPPTAPAGTPAIV